MWRWGISIGLTLLAAGVSLFANADQLPIPVAGPRAGALVGYWAFVALLTSPTILLYRAAIWLGEWLLPRQRAIGAASMLALTAILPPLAYNAALDHASAAQTMFAEPPAAGYRTVLIQTEGGHSGAEHGITACGVECSKLLFGAGVDRVILSHRNDGVRGLRIERRPTCPPLSAGNRVDDRASRAGVAITSAGASRWLEPELGERVHALVASGYCPVVHFTLLEDADLMIGTELKQWPVAGSYAFVEQRTPSGWKRLSQRPNVRWIHKWLVPFAIQFRGDDSWVSTVDRSWSRRGPDYDWAWAGIRMPMPPWIGSDAARDALRAGVMAPVDQPRDARHQLVMDYLNRLEQRPADDVDIALPPLIISDQRVAPGDLNAIDRFAPLLGTMTVATLLIERIERTDPANKSAILVLANLVAQLPRKDRPMLLPLARRLLRDEQRRASAHEVFMLFEHGDARDADLMLALFRDNLPRESVARMVHPLPKAIVESERRRADNLKVALTGLCALAGSDERVRPALIDVARTTPPERWRGLWELLGQTGVDVAELADRFGASAEGHRVVGRIASSGRSTDCT